MDSPIVAQLFRQLFAHRPCRSHAALPFRIQNGRQRQIRCFSSQRPRATEKSRSESNWQQRTDIFPHDMSEEYAKYPMVTAEQLRGRRERPRRVKMLTRDFIEGMQKQRNFHYAKLMRCKTLYITRPMATFRSKLSFLRRGSNLISTTSKTNRHSTASWVNGIQNLRMG
jgi:hypothetical protein